MNEGSRLSPEACAFLDEVRDAEDPTREDEERVKRALDAGLAAGGGGRSEPQTPRGETPGPTAAGPGDAAAVVAKAGALTWGAPLTVIALCAAAWFTWAEGDGGAQPRAALPPAEASRAAPGEPVRSELEPPRERAAGGGGGELVDPANDERGSAARAAAADAGPPPGAGQRPGPAAARATAASRRKSGGKDRESDGLAAEVALLRRAQAALQRGDGAGALRELEAFRGRGGQLLAERRAARVLALCSLGRVAEAQTLAAEIVRSDPGSMQRAALERSCANPPRDRGP